MLDDLEFDDGDAPPIGLVPPGVSWDDVRDHIKIMTRYDPAAGRRRPVRRADPTGTDMVVLDYLGPDQDEAVEEFRVLPARTRRDVLVPGRGAADARRRRQGMG